MQLWYFYTNNNTACLAIADRIPSEARQIDCKKHIELCGKYGVENVPLFLVVDACDEEVARLETVDTTKVMTWYKGVCNGNTQSNA